MSKRNNFFGSKSGLTARTIAFLAATGISDTTIANALNTMDLALIANGLDTKMKALYPFVGGTATTHKWNFMNALDTDAAFRLTFAGGWTHSTNGALANGTNGYASTHLYPFVTLAQFSIGVSFYSRTAPYASGDQHMWGAFSAGKGQITNDIYNSGTKSFVLQNDTGFIDTAIASTTRLISVSRTANNSVKLYRDGAVVASSSSVTALSPANNPLFISATSTAPTTGAVFSKFECALFAIHDGFNDAESATMASLVNTFQTSLSRNV